VNKYFLGYELPAEHRVKLVKAQALTRDTFKPTTRVLPPTEFHVTSLFLGKCPRSAAEDLCNTLAWGFGSIYFRFQSVAVFDSPKGPHALVLKLHDLYGNAEMMHRVLRESASVHPEIKMDGKRWPYNPHVTIAKCEGSPDMALSDAERDINAKMSHNVNGHEFHVDHLTLFEKVDGATAYEPYRMLQLR
jgi:2'-5' RNA ligase